MASTEQSFMKALFHGVIAEDVAVPYPDLSGNEYETVRLMRDSVRRFGEHGVNSRAIDQNQEIPPSVMATMKELGLFGLAIPTEHGGLGLSATGYAKVLEELAGIDVSLAVTVAAHQSIGLRALLLYGTSEQKQRYLPQLASGQTLAAFALTESESGSDASSISTHAELADNRESYFLNGSKTWVTNGGIADLFTVFARTSQPGHKPRITALLVERGIGVQSGPNEHKMGIRGASTTSVYFDNVRVPVQNILGDSGKGFMVAMDVLNSGRLGLAASTLGGCKTLIKLASSRALERQAFGRPIAEFGMIKEKFARMAAEIYALESMTYLTTGLVDRGVADYSLESAICKVFGSETLWSVVNETMQIAAGIGYMTEYPYERWLRDARINMIFEGTNEILRAFIALAGLQGPGKQLEEVSKAMREPIKGFGLLSDFALQKARSTFGRERCSRIHPLLRRETVLFEDCVAALTRESERVLRKHGRDIAERQFVQKRIAEVAIDLYALFAVLSRTTLALERLGEGGAQRELIRAGTFAALAEPRLRARLDHMERDEDERMKAAAGLVYEDRGYLSPLG